METGTGKCGGKSVRYREYGTAWNAWAQRPVWAAAIVVADPFTEDLVQMSRIERNDVVQTFATNGSDQSFAMCVGRRHTNRRSQYVDAPTLHLFIETGGEGLMPIMQEKLAITIVGECFA